MPSATRWAGVSAADRQAERRALLVRAALGLFGDGGEGAVSVRSVCRAAELNTRYFYESFTDTDELLGAVYDEVAGELGAVLTAAMASAHDDRSRLRSGIRAVLDFSSADPRRGKILFTEARTNPVLAARRTLAQDHLRELVLDEQRRTVPESDRVATEVGAAMYAGAMAELAQQWLAGTLGDDVDAVVTHAVRLLLPN
ncbi:TetR family transcriptional regulator [Mycobacterium sp. CVI_P3]|uniref:TetR family transcriptional regulator n=1 Tax=Mycobacterium pinniadriaticum TaxID=2994102 RepID=A0ABT3SIU6_9MYCO|nr:TetR family transcriptional regulator [Mycobacterium pinniadriaticum]MCX2933027.1 TetR family transcriptional regulator [Mycobacterium pinniadriaticum]MCX2939449.1 TetR family transcriptional regulator [Mycobacterium pinniadriaticum]